ncbi:MAG: FAD-dependent oxidoreductase [Verrucomicrobia bacterium]|nr:FAD-dependent oxidoreductase [Verrucomicrobiota bacterium]
MDCVRTAVRLGSSEVICCYRRSEHEMPAEKIEVEQAKQEGVQFEFLTAPVRLRQEGGRKILTCQKMTLGEPDASGRRRPVVIDGSEFDLAADTVISAIGQKTVLPHGVKSDRWGNVAVDNDDYSVEAKIFAAGDCVSGPASVVEAVAAGRIVALGIVNSFQGKKYQRVYEINVSRGHWGSLSPEQLVFLNDHDPVKRVAPRFLSIENRKSSFAEVSLTLTREEIAQEGRRCIECSCGAKIHCRLKRHSEEYGADLQRFVGEKRDYGYDRRHPTIIIDCNKCIKCGICVKICKEVVTQSLLGFKQRGSRLPLLPSAAPLPRRRRLVILEPDKIGELGFHGYLRFYQITGITKYRDAAIACADALALRCRVGNVNQSPWPFRANAQTGALGSTPEDYGASVAGPLQLFDELIRLNLGDVAAYQTARARVWTWLMTYPMVSSRDVSSRSSHRWRIRVGCAHRVVSQIAHPLRKMDSDSTCAATARSDHSHVPQTRPKPQPRPI